MATLNENGHEVLDNTPVAVAFPVKRSEPLHLQIRRMIMAAQADIKAQGYETEEEANDFEVGDEDFDFASPHEDVYRDAEDAFIRDNLDKFELYKKSYLASQSPPVSSASSDSSDSEASKEKPDS